MSALFDRHPDANVLAAFVEGKLSAEERRELEPHLEQCDECLDLVGSAAAIDREFRGEAEVKPFRRRWIPTAIAAAIAIAAGLGAWSLWKANADPAEPVMRALASMKARPLEPRLSRAAYKPYDVMRGSGSNRPLGLEAAAAAVMEKSSAKDDAAHQRAAGVAALVAGDSARAEQYLVRAVALDDASGATWSDLAAAQYQSARRTDNRRKLVLALTSADRALSLDPVLASALFNRALILEALGRRDAISAWHRAWRADAESGWGREAAERADRLR